MVRTYKRNARGSPPFPRHPGLVRTTSITRDPLPAFLPHPSPPPHKRRGRRGPRTRKIAQRFATPGRHLTRSKSVSRSPAKAKGIRNRKPTHRQRFIR